jgi:hypothetical protein
MASLQVMRGLLADEAFRIELEPHRRAITLHCYRMLGSLEEAEEMAQESLLRAWQLAVHPGIVQTHMMLQASGAFRVYRCRSRSLQRAAPRRPSTWRRRPRQRKSRATTFSNSRRTDTKSKFNPDENRALLWDLSLKSVQDRAVTAPRRAG